MGGKSPAFDGNLPTIRLKNQQSPADVPVSKREIEPHSEFSLLLFEFSD